VHYARARRNHIYVLTPAVGEAAASSVEGRRVRSAGSGGLASARRHGVTAETQRRTRARPATRRPTHGATTAADGDTESNDHGCRRRGRGRRTHTVPPDAQTVGRYERYTGRLLGIHANSHAHSHTHARLHANVLHTRTVDLSPLLARHVVGALKRRLGCIIFPR